jgi:2-methylcitrate dehydratase
MIADPTIERLVRYVSSAGITRLPASAVHEARRRLIDSIACAAAAYPEAFCVRLRGIARNYSGVPAGRIWGSGESTSIEMAAFVNGTMLRYFDSNDTYLGKAAGHPSDMIGALIALADAFACSGAALLTSIVVAYQVYCGLCEAVALQARGVDQSTCAAVGTAAGAGYLLGIGQEHLANALSLALGPNINLYNVRCGSLSDWKGCAGPNGARNGVFAALLAKEGVTGPTAIVEGKGGLAELVGKFDWEIGEGTPPLITRTHLKFHPVCYHGQSALDAAIALRDQISIDDIAEIQVETYDAAVRAMAGDPQRWAPANRETADHSLPYTIAVALLEGRLTSDAYAKQRLGDLRTKRLMDKVKVSSSAQMSAQFPAQAQTRISVVHANGEVRSHLQENPRGNAANPLSDRELESKFIELYAPWGGEQRAQRVLELLWSSDRVANVATIVDVACIAPV